MPGWTTGDEHYQIVYHEMAVHVPKEMSEDDIARVQQLVASSWEVMVDVLKAMIDGEGLDAEVMER